MPQLKFEKALSRLEETVESLEKGDLSLEKALKVFEDGVHLSKICMKTLSDAEKKVEILIEDKGNKKKTRPFNPKKTEDSDQDLSHE